MMLTTTQRCSGKMTTNRATTPAILERMEQRMLMSVTTFSGSPITEITDYCLYADARIGDNGDPWGKAGVSAATTVEEVGASIRTWDEDLSNGLDSGAIGFTFTVDMANGSMSWEIDGADTITNPGYFGTSISQVDIRAGVLSGGMAFTFSTVSVKFYSGSTLIDTESVSSISANTLGAQTSDPAESRAIVTPDAQGSDKVIITGKVRLQAAQGIVLGTDCIFGQIFIHNVA